MHKLVMLCKTRMLNNVFVNLKNTNKILSTVFIITEVENIIGYKSTIEPPHKRKRVWDLNNSSHIRILSFAPLKHFDHITL